MKFYKVLYRLKNGVRYSSGSVPDNLQLTYKLGIKNYPKIKGSKLFVFGEFYSSGDTTSSYPLLNHFKYALDYPVRYKSISEPTAVEIWEVECESLEDFSYRKVPRVWCGELENKKDNYISDVWAKCISKKMPDEYYKNLVNSEVYFGSLGCKIWAADSIKLLNKTREQKIL